MYLEQYKIKDFISIKIPTILLPSDLPLHKGEVEAISLAKELDLGLLIEDADGKEYAKRLGIQVSGIAGQILKAK